MWTRRRVIFVGVTGALAAGAAVVLPRLRTSGAAPAGAGLVVNHSDMLRAVALALLGPALAAAGPPRDAQIDSVLKACAALIDNLPASTRREIGDLFGLLAIKPARALLGYGGDWPGADDKAVNVFLAGLRESSIGLKQQAYFALHDMVLGSFYADSATWGATGYPGPPKLA